MVCVEIIREVQVPGVCCAALDVQDLCKTFDKGRFRSLSLSLGGGEIMGVFGETEAGKSTLIDLLNGHIKPDAGRIILDGKDITELSPEDRAQRGIAFTPPADWLHPDLTAFENIMLLSEQYNWPLFPRRNAPEPGEGARLALDFVGLMNFADQRVEILSPMQRQLLTVATGLARRPRVLLLDDPWKTWATARSALSNQLIRIAQSGIAVFFTAHYSRPVTEICDRIAILRPKDAAASRFLPMDITVPSDAPGYTGYIQ